MDTKEISSTLQLILDVTEELIMEKGCQKTTLQDMIDRSGLSKGAIYHYVKSKDELFALILQNRQKQMNAAFFENVASDKGVFSPFQGIAQRFEELSHSDQVSNLIFIYLLSKIENKKIQSILQKQHEDAIQMGEEWIEVGKQYQVIPENVDAKKMSDLLNIFRYGLQISQLIATQSQIREEDIYQFLIKTLIK